MLAYSSQLTFSNSGPPLNPQSDPVLAVHNFLSNPLAATKDTEQVVMIAQHTPGCIMPSTQATLGDALKSSCSSSSCCLSLPQCPHRTDYQGPQENELTATPTTEQDLYHDDPERGRKGTLPDRSPASARRMSQDREMRRMNLQKIRENDKSSRTRRNNEYVQKLEAKIWLCEDELNNYEARLALQQNNESVPKEHLPIDHSSSGSE